MLLKRGIKPGVGVPPGVREDMLGGYVNLKKYIYILFYDKH
jgi:hypothetical protein